MRVSTRNISNFPFQDPTGPFQRAPAQPVSVSKGRFDKTKKTRCKLELGGKGKKRQIYFDFFRTKTQGTSKETQGMYELKK